MASGALLLAAGFARRFGSDKRRFRLPNGDELLLATTRRYLEIFTSVAVVLRSEDGQLAQNLVAQLSRNPPLIIATDQAELGLGQSIADGVRAVATWDHAFIGLADMPFVTKASLHTLLYHMLQARRETSARIVQPQVAGERGHPVGFSCDFFPELMELKNDSGARSVIQKHPQCLQLVTLDDSGLITDLDRPLTAV